MADTWMCHESCGLTGWRHCLYLSVSHSILPSSDVFVIPASCYSCEFSLNVWIQLLIITDWGECHMIILYGRRSHKISHLLLVGW